VDFADKELVMILSAAHVAKLEQFLEQIKGDTYPEPPSGQHTAITAQMLDYVFSTCALPQGARVLDVGCGQGVALQHFVARGCNATGITLNAVDREACQQQGYDVLEMDQSFLEFPDAQFDLVWCRHCLEHSVLPYFTLHEFRRVLKPGGWLYVEVPAPDTSCQHQQNQNHYSVLGKTMLASLLGRAGFRIHDVLDITFTVPAGPDMYWAFMQQKV
jgi:SAM-dependent methyltransferase